MQSWMHTISVGQRASLLKHATYSAQQSSCRHSWQVLRSPASLTPIGSLQATLPPPPPGPALPPDPALPPLPEEPPRPAEPPEPLVPPLLPSSSSSSLVITQP